MYAVHTLKLAELGILDLHSLIHNLWLICAVVTLTFYKLHKTYLVDAHCYV